MTHRLFTIYSEFDETTIAKASSLNLPLIGGTALEVLGSYYGIPCHRKRSDNDLDFTTNSNEAQIEFSRWVQQNTVATKIQVDIMLVKSHKIRRELMLDVQGIKVMAPEYLIWSKLQRFNGRDRDDIKWLLNITTAEKLECWFEKLGVTDLEIERINEIINEGDGKSL